MDEASFIFMMISFLEDNMGDEKWARYPFWLYKSRADTHHSLVRHIEEQRARELRLLAPDDDAKVTLREKNETVKKDHHPIDTIQT